MNLQFKWHVPQMGPAILSLEHVKRLGAPGFWYLGTPYTRYPGGADTAHQIACKVANLCLEAGLLVYCPIAHWHPIAMLSGRDPLDLQTWLPVNQPMMDAASGMLIAQMKGWSTSGGIAHEYKFFFGANKPVVHIEGDFDESRDP